jgi:hypothetical protein
MLKNKDMDLPKKDKYGVNRLSYSQIQLFKKNKDRFYQRYIVGEKFKSNEYIDFGNKVGKALESNDFSNFDYIEQETLKKVTRLDEFERRVFLRYTDFYLVGYIDTNNLDLSEIIDYKTGGVKKELQYMDEEYNQLQIYALGIKQETGFAPKKGSVEFIRRVGNLYRGQRLMVGDEEPIKIDVDLSHKKLNDVYSDVLRTAIEIDEFYKKNK